MQTKVIREKFLNFFKNNGHTVVESSSLIPINDSTLLFTNAGMVQFKDTFLGKEKRAYNTATSAQKCVRAGGKHNDLDNVGYTARHHTFFEMLGNFSFGAYFKEQAISYAWKFSTQELGLPVDKLYVSIYKDDNEAFEIWNKKIGLPEERIFRFGEKDNFWSMGDTGPCGPCSELFIDRGEKYGCHRPECTVGCDCDRFMEFWNLVFMQYNRDSSGKLTPLPKPSVDTGAGLERLASILQNVDSNYDIDIFKNILVKTAALVNKTYDSSHSKDDIALRVIADHARSSTFLIADGVLPSNEGRGYVLRRIIRRAVRYGRKLGFNSAFLYKVSRFVVDEMKDQYPYLEKQFSLIENYIKKEEEQFFKTLENGLTLLEDEIKKLKQSNGSTLSGEVVFKLYDTYGFPMDLTSLICKESSIGVDEKDFDLRMQEQKSRSKKSWKKQNETPELDEFISNLTNQSFVQNFVGYSDLKVDSKCLNFIPSKDPSILIAVFEKTSFYAESGGQVADTGVIYSNNFKAEVIDVKKKSNIFLHYLKIKEGSLDTDTTYTLEVDSFRRSLIARNHSSVHLLHWALREKLGEHVKQAGSFVSDSLFRLDFTHFEQIDSNLLKEIESMINEKIWKSIPVKTEVLSKKEALDRGALAFFEEKYADTVRVVSVGDFSKELCGGTHVSNTNEINIIKLISEESVASGVRRIVGLSSKQAYTYCSDRVESINKISSLLNSKVEDTVGRVDKLLQEDKNLKLSLDKYIQNELNITADSIISRYSKTISNVSCIAGVFDVEPKYFRPVVEIIRNKKKDSIVIAGNDKDRASLIVGVGDSLVEKYSANNLLKNMVGFIDGRGGGKKELAQAGGNKKEGFNELFDSLDKIII